MGTEQRVSAILWLRDALRSPATVLMSDAGINQNTDPLDYIRAFPLAQVGEIHLGGHDEDLDAYGERLLIDSHGAEVVDPVWALYRQTVALAGPRPTLIEWENDVPDWPVLAAEAARAAAILAPVA